MEYKNYLKFCLLIFSSLSLADNPSNLQEVRDYCLQESKKYTCNFKEKGTFGYTPSWGSRSIGKYLWDAVRLVNEGVRTVQKYNTSGLFLKSGCGYGADVGEILLDTLKSELQIFSDRKKLSNCQKTCLALCASSNYITYTGSTVSSVCKIAATGEGICGNFSWFATDLLKSLGINATTAYGVYDDDGNRSPHNWVSVELNGKKYYAEPQRSSCDLYQK